MALVEEIQSHAGPYAPPILLMCDRPLTPDEELELARLEKEVEALRVAAPLLSETSESISDTATSKPTLTTPAPQQPIRIPQPQVAVGQPTARAAGWEDSAKRWP